MLNFKKRTMTMLLIFAILSVSIPFSLFAMGEDVSVRPVYSKWMKNYADDIVLTNGYGYDYSSGSGILSLYGRIDNQTAWPKTPLGIKLDVSKEYVYEFDVCQNSAGSSSYFRPAFFDTTGGDNYSCMWISSTTNFQMGLYTVGSPANSVNTITQGSSFTLNSGSNYHFTLYFKNGKFTFWVDDTCYLDKASISVTGNPVLNFGFAYSDNDVTVKNIKIYNPSEKEKIPTLPQGNIDYVNKCSQFINNSAIFNNTNWSGFRFGPEMAVDIKEDWVFTTKFTVKGGNGYGAVRFALYPENTQQNDYSSIWFAQHYEMPFTISDHGKYPYPKLTSTEGLNVKLNADDTENSLTVAFVENTATAWFNGVKVADELPLTSQVPEMTKFVLGLETGSLDTLEMTDTHLFRMSADKEITEDDDSTHLPSKPNDNKDFGTLTFENNSVSYSSLSWNGIRLGNRMVLDITGEWAFSFDAVLHGSGFGSFAIAFFPADKNQADYSRLLLAQHWAPQVQISPADDKYPYPKLTSGMGGNANLKADDDVNKFECLVSNGKITLWVNGVKVGDELALTTSVDGMTKFALGVAGDCGVDLSNIHLYSLGKDPLEDDFDDKSDPVPVKPENNIDYAKRMNCNISRVSGATYVNNVLTLSDVDAEDWITFDGISMNKSDNFVYEAVICTDTADAEWKGIRMFISDFGFSNIMSVPMFEKNIFLYNEQGTAITLGQDSTASASFERELGKEYKITLLYNGDNQTVSVWVDDVQMLKDVPIICDSPKIGFGLKAEKATGTVKNISIYKTDTDTEGDSSDDKCPTMPKGNTDYIEDANIDISRLNGARQQDGVIMIDDEGNETYITFENVSFSSNESFVFEMDINTNTAKENWWGIRPCIADTSYSNIMTLAPFDDWTYLLSELGSGIEVVDSADMMGYAKRELDTTYHYQIYYNGSESTISVWIDGIAIYSQVPIKVTPSRLGVGFKVEKSTGVISNIHIYKTEKETSEKTHNGPKVPKRPSHAREYGVDLKLIDEHVANAGIKYKNGCIVAAKKTGDCIVATKVGFIPEASFVFEATVNVDRQDQPWQNIRLLLGSYGWQDYTSFSMFGKEAYVYNEVSLHNLDVNKSGENVFVPIKYGKDYKLSLFYNGKQKTVSMWIDDEIIYQDMPITVDSHVINLGFKFAQTTGSVKNIHIYKTDSGLVGVPEYVNSPYKGYQEKSPLTGDSNYYWLIIEMLISAAFVFGTVATIILKNKRKAR